MKLDPTTKDRLLHARVIARLLKDFPMRYFATTMSTAYNYTYGNNPNYAQFVTHTATGYNLHSALEALKETCSNDDFANFSPLAGDEIFVGMCGKPTSVRTLTELIDDDSDEARNLRLFSADDWAEYDEWKAEQEENNA